MVFDEAGAVLAERAASIGRATNNVAEYSGLIAGLEAAHELGAATVTVRMDSKLVVEQLSGRWKIKHPDMKPLADKAFALVERFDAVTFEWVPRARNARADRLANEAMDEAAAGRVGRHGGPRRGAGAGAGHPADPAGSGGGLAGPAGRAADPLPGGPARRDDLRRAGPVHRARGRAADRRRPRQAAAVADRIGPLSRRWC